MTNTSSHYIGKGNLNGKTKIFMAFINDPSLPPVSSLLLVSLLHVPHWCFILTCLTPCALPFFPPIVSFCPPLLFLVIGSIPVAFGFVWLGLTPVPTKNILVWVLITTVCKCKTLMATIFYFSVRNTNKKSLCLVEIRFGTSCRLIKCKIKAEHFGEQC